MPPIIQKFTNSDDLRDMDYGKSIGDSPNSATKYSNSGLRILLAEPCDRTRSAIKSTLMRLGYSRIIESSSLEQAKKTFFSCQTNLIICNLQFPDGLASSLLQDVRRVNDLSQLPFIFLLNKEDESLGARLAGLPFSAQVPSSTSSLLLQNAILALTTGEQLEQAETPTTSISEPTHSAIANESSVTIRFPDIHKLRVVLVDPDSNTRAITEQSLKGLGVNELYVTDSGSVALKRAESARADLIFCEWKTKDISGIELLRALRSNELCCEVPFVMLTSKAESEQVLQALRLRADDYLLKPSPEGALVEMFNRVVRLEELNEFSKSNYKGICLDDTKALETAKNLIRSANTTNESDKIKVPDIRILLVDEDEKFRRICGACLRRMGFQKIMETSSAASALKKLESGLVDLVFSEWSVCQVSGLEILRSIRSVDFLKAVPFIMLTETCSRDKVLDALRAGVNDYLVKPCNAETLAEALARIMVSRT